jgi:membrane-bound metal-dependent hydrolase YbcI (DUF457 family)
MMGVTHGLAGAACAAAIAATATAIGTPLEPAELAAVFATATLAAEAPDLDLPTSRISHGTSTLTAVRALRPLALVITLPLVLLGAITRSRGASHRGPTHSILGALASTPIVLGAYTLYLLFFDQLAQLADEHRPANVSLRLADLTGALLDGWTAALPLAALAWLAGYLTHLLLDDLTASGQQLLWPARTTEISVTRWPQIKVGGLAELLCVALPLAALTATLTLSLANTAALRDRLADNPTLNDIRDATTLPRPPR